MKHTIHNVEQKSPEWFELRCGRLTGSEAGDIMAVIKNGEAASRRNLRYRKALERMTGNVEVEDLSRVKAVQHGIEREPHARMRFEGETGLIVRETGFLRAEELLVGCSLDGDIDDMRAILEVKCPNTATHIGYLEDGKLPASYLWQVTHNVWVSGAKEAHFVSFDDRLEEGLDYFHIVVAAEALPIERYEAEATKFLKEVDDLIDHLTNLKQRRAA